MARINNNEFIPHITMKNGEYCFMYKDSNEHRAYYFLGNKVEIAHAAPDIFSKKTYVTLHFTTSDSNPMYENCKPTIPGLYYSHGNYGQWAESEFGEERFLPFGDTVEILSVSYKDCLSEGVYVTLIFYPKSTLDCLNTNPYEGKVWRECRIIKNDPTFWEFYPEYNYEDDIWEDLEMNE